MTRQAVITGIGAVTPLGVGAHTLHERWTAGSSGIEDGFGRCSEFEPKDHLSVKEIRRADRFTQLALAAAKEAIDDAGWEDGKPPISPDRAGSRSSPTKAGSSRSAEGRRPASPNRPSNSEGP